MIKYPAVVVDFSNEDEVLEVINEIDQKVGTWDFTLALNDMVISWIIDYGLTELDVDTRRSIAEKLLTAANDLIPEDQK